MNGEKRLIVVVGPTAIGKTALAIDIAEHIGTEILSCDSRQFYKELSIGVARPSDEELARAKHHFIANLSVADYYNVSMYEQQALQCLEKLYETHDVAVAVGGSGLYVDALCNGIADLPDPDPELRDKLKKEYEQGGIEELRFQLKFLDYDYYQEVDLANHARILRALEVCYMTGRPFSEVRKQAQKVRPFQITKIGMRMDRDALNFRINQRVDIMMDCGLLQEAKAMYQNRNFTALNTVGYKELFAYMDDEMSLELAVEKIKTNTRRYAKRQMTWLRRYADINWIDVNSGTSSLDLAMEIIGKKSETQF